MKPEDFDEKEAADSMRAAAARLDVPLEFVKHSKRQGSRAFRGGRVYLRPLAEMIANGQTEIDTILFPVPTGPGASSKTVSEFRELLRVAIRCGWVTTPEILAIIVDQVIQHFRGARPGREAAEVFDKLTRAIHQGFGVAVMLLDDPATDDFLKRSAAAFDRVRKKLFQSDPARRACK